MVPRRAGARVAGWSPAIVGIALIGGDLRAVRAWSCQMYATRPAAGRRPAPPINVGVASHSFCHVDARRTQVTRLRTRWPDSPRGDARIRLRPAPTPIRLLTDDRPAR